MSRRARRKVKLPPPGRRGVPNGIGARQRNNLPASTFPPGTAVPKRPVYEKRPPGRPSLLTPEVQDRFIIFLRAGVTRQTAAMACGLKPDTVEGWVSRAKGRDPANAPKPEYTEFLRMVLEAEAAAKALVEGNLVGLTRKHPAAAIYWLKTKYPKEYGPGVEFPLLPAGPGDLTIDQRTQNIVLINPDDFPELTSKLLAARRAQAPDEPIALDEVTVIEGASTTRSAGLREDVTGDPG